VWLHLLNLIRNSWHLFLAGQGTTGLGFLSPFAVAVLSGVIVAVVIWKRSGLPAMKGHWKKNVAHVLLGAIGGVILWYGTIFSWIVVKVIYQDHMDLIAENQRLREAKPSDKRPLEIISLSSIGEIAIENNGSDSIFVKDFLINVRQPKSSMSHQLNLEIEPGAIGKKEIREELGNVTTIPDLAKTWPEHYEKAVTLYQACGLKLVFFSSSDTEFQQIKRYYSGQGRTLVFDDILITLHYLVKGSHETKTQQFSGVIIIMVNSKCLPS